MPVRTVRRGARIEGTSGLGEGVTTGRMVKGYRASVKVDLVRNVVPLVCD